MCTTLFLTEFNTAMTEIHERQQGGIIFIRLYLEMFSASIRDTSHSKLRVNNILWYDVRV